MSEVPSDSNQDLELSYAPLSGYMPEETQQMYPFGYYVIDGEIYGRDPLQELSAGLVVPEEEIAEAFKLAEDSDSGITTIYDEYLDTLELDFSLIRDSVRTIKSQRHP